MLRRTSATLRALRPLCAARRAYATSDDFVSLTRNLSSPETPRVDATDVDRLDWSHLGDLGDDASEPYEAPVQKEQLIFKEVMDQVLATNSAPARRAPGVQNGTSAPRSSTPLSDSILSLFDRPTPAAGKATSGRTSVASLMEGLLQRRPEVSPAEAARQARIDALVEPVVAHIRALPTNADVIAYFEETIVPAFDKSESAPAPVSDPASDPASTGKVDVLNPVVNSETVALLLEACVSTLAWDFDDQLGALQLFENAKHHSITLFSEGCSAPVYNQIIRMRWECYRDLYAVLTLASEIAINAIQPTLETTELLARVYREATDSSKGLDVSNLNMPLWTGQDIVRLEELNRYRLKFQNAWAARPTLRS